MKIKVKIFHPALSELTKSHAEVFVSGATVGDCLKDFTQQFPGAHRWIFDDQGRLLEQVFVYINAEGTNKATLNDPVKQGDELILARIFIGG